MQGWVFAKFNDHMWHIELSYLSPVRRTYLRVHILRTRLDDVVDVEMCLGEDGMLATMTEVEITHFLDLSGGVRIRLYKLCAWESPQQDLTIGKCLTLQPLDRCYGMVTNDRFRAA